MLGFRVGPRAPAAGAMPGPATASVVAARRSTVTQRVDDGSRTGAFYRFPNENQMIPR